MDLLFPTLGNVDIVFLTPQNIACIAPGPMKRIMLQECRAAGISLAEMTGSSTSRKYVEPRHKAMIRCRTELGASLPEIGKAFNRDQSTVNNAVRKG